MNKMNQLWAISGIAVALAFSRTNGLAQAAAGGMGRGGFGGGVVLTSPARLQQQAENMRLSLGVTNDEEWVIISPRLVKVMQLQAEARLVEIANMARGGGGGRLRALPTVGVGTDPDPTTEALTKALDDNAPVAEIKSAMARVRQARKAKQAEMARAQADLQSVVSIRQEAILLNSGLLD